MLRGIVIVVAALALVGGVAALVLNLFPPAIVFVLWGALILVGTLGERFRYKPIEPRRPGPGWTATDERFIDDETGKEVTVFIHSSTGERKYVNS